ncbi:DNA repair protein SbcC/Rad50 [Staphylococcus hominis]
MKPVKLTLNNFGPFLHETIDFTQIKDDQLFLISGKTGSGKTMIFDAIVFSLFGKASTEGRSEAELRSHFAEAKSPMWVQYEFQLNEKYFKIFRQGAFTKEGNTSQTPGKLDVYEYDSESNTYELRESKISAGNQYIKSLLGVNAEQFRQLFILPQGEFKKFLVSKSTDKQGILRTLFNSIRFEEIQKLLQNEVKEEKKQIEKRYNQIKLLWEDIEAFDDEQLIQFKQIHHMKTQELIQTIPDFRAIGHQIEEKRLHLKNEQNEQLLSITKRIDLNKTLEQQLSELKEYHQLKHQLDEQIEDISALKVKLNQLNDASMLFNLYDQQRFKEEKYQTIKTKIIETENKISQLNNKINMLEEESKQLDKMSDSYHLKSESLEQSKPFYNYLNKYQQAFKEQEHIIHNYNEMMKEQEKLIDKEHKMSKSIDSYKVDNKAIDVLTEKIYQLQKQLDEQQVLKNNYEKQVSLKEQYHRHSEEVQNLKEDIETLNYQLETIDKQNIDLNDKQTFITEIQSALHIGDTCPICGNEIESLNQHIDFETINQNQQLLSNLSNEINEKKHHLSKIETTCELLSRQISDLGEIVYKKIDFDQLKEKLQYAKSKKVHLQEQLEELDKLKQKFNTLQQQKHQQELKVEKLASQKHQNRTLIQDFEKGTGYSNIETFKTNYLSLQKEVDEYYQHVDDSKKNMQSYQNTLTLEKNNIDNYLVTSKELQKELDYFTTTFQKEMKRLGLKNEDEIKKMKHELQDKEEIEKRINHFDKQQHKYSVEIERLTHLTSEKKLENITNLEIQKKHIEEKYNQCVNDVASIQYKIKKNDEKFEKIEEHIHYLDEELKEQQQIFNLSEVLSGKNQQKLSLENYVLIYYLERIIYQANIRLDIMSGRRYQLKRSESVSQGYSGLEIEVFDLYSNKSRHISSLSGGETFQASLALALGLSEVVQQESGGITLESMFIDEGFGTLDQETLETSLDTLLNLKISGRMVGIISHVSELKQRIPLILEVNTNQYQSSTKFKWK